MNRMVDARPCEDGVKVVKGNGDDLVSRALRTAKDSNKDAFLDVPQTKRMVGGSGGHQFEVFPVDLEKDKKVKITK